jgi:hypothetical protein
MLDGSTVIAGVVVSKIFRIATSDSPDATGGRANGTPRALRRARRGAA